MTLRKNIIDFLEKNGEILRPKMTIKELYMENFEKYPVYFRSLKIDKRKYGILEKKEKVELSDMTDYNSDLDDYEDEDMSIQTKYPMDTVDQDKTLTDHFLTEQLKADMEELKIRITKLETEKKTIIINI